MVTWFIFNTLTYKSKINKKFPFLSCATFLFSLCSFLNSHVVFEGVVIFIYISILFVFSIIFFNDEILRKIVISILPFSFVAVASALSVNTMSVFFDKNATDLMSKQNIYRIITVVAGNVVLALLLLLVKIFINNNDIFLSKNEWFLMGGVLITSIVILLLLYLAVFESISYKQKTILVLSIVGVILINIIIYILLIQLSKKQKAVLESSLIKQEYQHQKEFTSALKDQYNQLQKIHHDFSNTLLVIQSLNNEGKQSCINSYITKYIEENKNTLKFVSTNNDYVNAVLNSKIAFAKNNNINVTFNIYTEIPNINQVDICNLLNNLFDNAIEACQKCDIDRIIFFEIRCNEMSLNISIKNSVPASVIALNPKLITDKENRILHGYGTKIIKDIAEKYHGYADFYEENNMFCCDVVLNLL